MVPAVYEMLRRHNLAAPLPHRMTTCELSKEIQTHTPGDFRRAQLR